MNAPSTTETTALALASSASAGSLLLHDASMDRLERLADMMASGKTTVPQHLRGSKADCFAIALQSMQWGMNPFAVAQKTHLVNGTLGYEAQLVAAVINTSGAVQDRFHFDWYGPWERVIGKFVIKKGDGGKEYRAPGWSLEDEIGCGMKVWATLKGETEPRVLDLLLAQARVRNSTLWAEDPKQQLAYLAQKRWSRLYAPDVILGVYTPDEIAEPSEKFMGAADVVQAAAGASSPAPATAAANATAGGAPEWTDAELLVKREPKIREFYGKGKTADEIIGFYSGKGVVSEKQKQAIRDMKPAAAPAGQAAAADAAGDQQVQDVAPKVTFAEVAEKLNAADTVEALDEAATLIQAVGNEQHRKELNDSYTARRAELTKGA